MEAVQLERVVLALFVKPEQPSAWSEGDRGRRQELLVEPDGTNGDDLAPGSSL